MIANPTVPAYRYDPYEKRLTSEGYNHAEMQHLRGQAVVSAQDSLKPLVKAESTWAVVLGTLGRQGSVNVLKVGSIAAHFQQGSLFGNSR
jgi:2-(3-amino-3-carboxypropyl)histidine synthase